MTHWKQLGTYLGRPVNAAACDSHEIHLKDMSNAVALLVLGRGMAPDMIRSVLRMLIGQRPLAIRVCGAGAVLAFDALIDEVGDGVPRRHIMTAMSEGDAIEPAIEELLQATWPTEEDFDDWKEYAVIVIDGNAVQVEKAIKKACE
jgi:hypothetical protein